MKGNESYHASGLIIFPQVQIITFNWMESLLPTAPCSYKHKGQLVLSQWCFYELC